MTDTVFALPADLAAKADPALVAADETFFAHVLAGLRAGRADLEQRLAAERRAPGGEGQAALERDQEIHRLTARLRTLHRYGADLCLGAMVPADGSAPTYVGRLGLTDPEGRRLLVDWRSPAARPFFAATLAEPLGLASRRRYRWTDGRITDYWDEVFRPGARTATAALDEKSAFLAGLGAARDTRMRDVLATLAADQDAVIRAGSSGALVVDGGPGTGKTVVALHRAAYLLHADPRVDGRAGGVLVVGPHRPYLDYVADVLPSLGEDGVRLCVLRDLLPEGATAVPEPDPGVAALKADAAMVRAVEAAVRIYEQPPTDTLVVETDWEEVRLTARDWAEAFAAPEPGTPHNDGQEIVWEAVVERVLDGHDADVLPEQVRTVLLRDTDLRATVTRAWPLLQPTDLVGDLWSVPAYLRACAPWLAADEVRALQRPDPHAWTDADLPLRDAARRLLGDPAAARTRRRARAAALAERRRMDRVVEDLIAADDSELMLMTSLRHDDLRDALVDPDALPALAADPWAGPFAHVVVDEAQELTDAQWQMVLARCPSGSLTVVGDRAQASAGFTESWVQRLHRVGAAHVRVATLGVNYRTPTEVMAEAEPVIRAVIPDANVPMSVRSSGLAVGHGDAGELEAVLATWQGAQARGVACVLGADGADTARVRHLTPELAKGLEFDLVVLVDPQRWDPVTRYVAMTRATQQLVVLTTAAGSPDRARPPAADRTSGGRSR